MLRSLRSIVSGFGLTPLRGNGLYVLERLECHELDTGAILPRTDREVFFFFMFVSVWFSSSLFESLMVTCGIFRTRFDS